MTFKYTSTVKLDRKGHCEKCPLKRWESQGDWPDKPVCILIGGSCYGSYWQWREREDCPLEEVSTDIKEIDNDI